MVLLKVALTNGSLPSFAFSWQIQLRLSSPSKTSNDPPTCRSSQSSLRRTAMSHLPPRCSIPRDPPDRFSGDSLHSGTIIGEQLEEVRESGFGVLSQRPQFVRSSTLKGGVIADFRGGVTRLIRTQFCRWRGRFSVVFPASAICGASPHKQVPPHFLPPSRRVSPAFMLASLSPRPLICGPFPHDELLLPWDQTARPTSQMG